MADEFSKAEANCLVLSGQLAAGRFRPAGEE
jgi:hypothetical protein